MDNNSERSAVIHDLMSTWRQARLSGDLRDDAAFRKMGLNRTDGRALDSLVDGPLSATELARRCSVTLTAVTTVIDRLVQSGFVERTHDTADRRRLVIARTAKADEVSDLIYGPLRKWIGGNLSLYTTDELQLLVRFTRMTNDVQEEHLSYISGLENVK